MKKSNPQIIYPPGLLLLILFGGPVALLPFLGRHQGRGFRAIIAVIAIVPFVAVLYFPGGWIAKLAVIFVYNTIFLSWLLKKVKNTRLVIPVLAWSGSLKNLPRMYVVAAPLSVIYVGLDIWLSDILWSSFIEINFSGNNLFKEFYYSILEFQFLLIFMIAICCRLNIKWNILNIFKAVLLTCLAFILTSQVYRLLISIPERQTIEANIFTPLQNFVRSEVISMVLLLSISLMVFYSLAHQVHFGKIRSIYIRSVLSMVLAMSGMAWFSGMTANYSLILGRQYEKYGNTKSAIYWYSRTLKHVSSEDLKSYLQFHLGLLNRKEGDLEGSRKSFAKVVLKFNRHKELVTRAHRFQSNLSDSLKFGLKRQVIPGVEARTEYKAAYCVPNSLGLVLNYWGDEVGARQIGAEITKIDEGSYITDEAYFSEMRGFKHFILPLQSRQNIIRLIDNNIPVLGFIPGHVIAILGYDKILETYITYDVNTFEIWDERSWHSFEEEWNKSYNALGIVIPEEKVPLLDSLLGPNITEKSESYLQYLLCMTSIEDMHLTLPNLREATGKNLFFADWEYTFHSGEQVSATASDSVIYEFLLRNGTENFTVMVYLQSLIINNKYAETVKFLEYYRKENQLTQSMVAMLAGAYVKLGSPGQALELLMTINSIEEVNISAVEFLLHNREVMQLSRLGLQIAQKILNSKPTELNTGESAVMAYQFWREHTQISKDNVSKSINVIYNYLMEFNPFDGTAVNDLRLAFNKMKFREDNRNEKEIWIDRIEKFNAHVMILNANGSM